MPPTPTAAPADLTDDLAHILAAIPAGVWVAVISLVGILVTGVLTYVGTRKKTSADSSAQLMEIYRKDVTELRDRVTTAEALREEDRAARLAAEQEAREADDTIRDAHETLSDYRQWRRAVAEHIERGDPPPPPAPTWRIEAYEESHARRHPDQ